jgi:cytoskeletal protein RodZ
VYAWIWRKLPFGLWGKLTSSIVLVVAVGVLLWYVVFPWATPLLPFDDVQVGTTTGQQSGPDAVAPDDIPYSTHSNDPEPTPSR